MAYGFTYTLPTITGSHTDQAIVLIHTPSGRQDFPSAAIDGGSSSITTGGGPLRAYTDDTKAVRLPVHVVEFVAGATPRAEVWVKLPSVYTGATIYIEADAVETYQPAFTNTYGRNAVYSNDDRRYGLKDNSSTVVDYTGNDDGTLGGSGATTGSSPAFGSSNLEMNLTAYVGGLTDPFPGASHAAIRSWYKIPNEASNGVCGAWLGGDSNMSVLLFTGSNDLVNFRVSTGGTAATATSTSVVQNSAWHHVCGYWDGTTIKTMVDGALEGSASKTGTINTPSSAIFEIGRYNNNNSTIPDDMQEVSLSTNSNVTSDYIATEYANQSAAGAWGTVGTWADAGGGGTITGSGTITETVGTISGAGVRGANGTGVIAEGVGVVSGIATREITASGAITEIIGTISGSGSIGGVVTGSGAITELVGVISGTGVRQITGSGTLGEGVGVLSGVGVRQITGSGVIAGTLGSISGTGSRVITGSGAITEGVGTVIGVEVPSNIGGGGRAKMGVVTIGRIMN